MRAKGQTAFFALVTLACGAALPAEGPAAREPAKDEVLVSNEGLGDPSDIRSALTAAEDRFYARYNELNKDDEYDVSWRAVVQTGKRLAERSCEPSFVDDVKRDSASANMNSSRTVGGGSAPMNTSSSGKVSEKYAEFQKRLLRFASEDPGLQKE